MKQGWEEKMLKEIGVAQTGTTPKTADKDNYGDFIPFIKPADIDIYNDGEIRYNNDGLSEKGLTNGRKMHNGSILMVCIGATIGKLGFITRDVSCNQQVNSLTVKKEMDPKFVYYAMSTPSFFDQVIKNSAQATLPIINKGKWENLTITYPKSLHEQQRIVAILDEAFAAIAKAKANAEQNLKNTKELFESYLQDVFENKGEGWEEKTLKELTTLLGDGLHGTPKYTEDGDYHFINGNNLKDGMIEFKTSTKRVSIEEYNKYKKNLTDRTVMVSINGTLGNVAFYNNEKIILGKSACYFNMKDSVDKNYIKYVLSSPYFLLYAHKEATGATIKNVSLKTMREFIVPLPSLNEQQTIVQKIDALSSETKKLEAIYQQKINDLEELKKSVLQKAFAGELKEDLKEHFAENA